MKWIKKSWRLCYRLLLGIVGFIVVYALAIFILSRITVNPESKQTDDGIEIYIKSNGVHTDIVVPVTNAVRDWRREIAFNHTVSKDTTYQYIGFGWGDKGFYLNTPEWSDLKVSTACNAMFYLGTSAMHATFFHQMRETKRCVKINISKAEYRKLVAYIEQGFCGGKVTVIPNAHYGDDDSFYEGEGRYSLFYTCNSWANNALKAADQKAALWTLTDTGILCHYQ